MRRILLGSLVSALLLSSAYAQGFSVTITVDENGNGTFANSGGFFSPLPGVLAPDPGPGGLPIALTYDLLNPPGLVAGDLILFEPRGENGVLSDIVRFNLSSPTPVAPVASYSIRTMPTLVQILPILVFLQLHTRIN